ncbi:hypothetical protein B0H14DRAFT_2579347 [Mycena olivaceomarginata]|nr:hypothetical protein B0H14DRAFT_2579347 [Mycena olivaceomarginata]
MCGRSRSPTKAACGWASTWTKTTYEWAPVSAKTTCGWAPGLDKADPRVVLDTDKDAGDQARLFPKWACDAGRGAGCCVTPAGCEIGARRACCVTPAVIRRNSPSYGFFKLAKNLVSIDEKNEYINHCQPCVDVPTSTISLTKRRGFIFPSVVSWALRDLHKSELSEGRGFPGVSISLAASRTRTYFLWLSILPQHRQYFKYLAA